MPEATSRLSPYHPLWWLKKPSPPLDRIGGVFSDFFDVVTQWASDIYVAAKKAIVSAVHSVVDLFTPIGAFYDSQSAAHDHAPSIAGRTPVLLDANNNNSGLNPTLLAGRDANADGRLTGAELDGLRLWSDANENGRAETGEVNTLAARGVTAIAAADYGFYTRGNAARPVEPTQPALAADTPPAPALD